MTSGLIVMTCVDQFGSPTLFFELFPIPMTAYYYFIEFVSWWIKLLCFKNCLILLRWDMSKLLLNACMVMYLWVIITYHVYYVEQVALSAIYVVRRETNDDHCICICYWTHVSWCADFDSWTLCAMSFWWVTCQVLVIPSMHTSPTKQCTHTHMAPPN